VCLRINRMKTIGIDVNVLTRQQRTGVELYVFSLLQAMFLVPLQDDERVVLYASAVVEDLGPLPQGWSWSVLAWPFPKGWTHGRLSFELLTSPPTVFFSPGHEVPLMTGGARIVSTVHDLAFLRRPDLYSDSGRARQKWALNQNLMNAQRVIAISEVTKHDLVELKEVDDAIIDVIPLARPVAGDVEESVDILEKHQLDARGYFVSIGRLERKKNIAFLIQAFSRWKEASSSSMKLVLAGGWGWGKEAILAAARNSAYTEDIVFAGYITEEEKATLLTGAHGYCFPSSYEGFGMPILDAWYYRLPLIVSDIPIFREIAGDAALYAEEASLKDWENAFTKMTEEDNTKRLLLGEEHLKEYSWEKNAQLTWKTLRASYA